MNPVKNIANIVAGIFFETAFALFIIGWAALICFLIVLIYP